ncbi:MAG: hypothetical protein ABW189_08565 [Rickettsiales bacterium]
MTPSNDSAQPHHKAFDAIIGIMLPFYFFIAIYSCFNGRRRRVASPDPSVSHEEPYVDDPTFGNTSAPYSDAPVPQSSSSAPAPPLSPQGNAPAPKPKRNAPTPPVAPAPSSVTRTTFDRTYEGIALAFGQPGKWEFLQYASIGQILLLVTAISSLVICRWNGKKKDTCKSQHLLTAYTIALFSPLVVAFLRYALRFPSWLAFGKELKKQWRLILEIALALTIFGPLPYKWVNAVNGYAKAYVVILFAPFIVLVRWHIYDVDWKGVWRNCVGGAGNFIRRSRAPSAEN